LHGADSLQACLVEAAALKSILANLQVAMQTFSSFALLADIWWLNGPQIGRDSTAIGNC